MKVRYDESFLFPGSQLDYNRQLHGFGAAADLTANTRLGQTTVYLTSSEQSSILRSYPNLPIESNGRVLRSRWLEYFITSVAPGADDMDYKGLISDLNAAEASAGIIKSTAATQAAQDAVAAEMARQAAANAAAAAAAPLRDAMGQVEAYVRAVNGAFNDIRTLSYDLMNLNDTVGARALTNVGEEFVAKANQALAGAQAAAAAGDLAAVQQFAQVAAGLMADIRRQVQVADGQVAATYAESQRVIQAAAAVAAADAAEIARNRAAAEAAAAAQAAAAQQAAAAEAARQAAANAAAQKAAQAEFDAARPQVAAQMQAEREATAARAAQAAKDATAAAVSTASSIVGYDLAVSALKAAGKYIEGMSAQQMSAALTALEGGNPVTVMSPAATATAIAATGTQTAATNTSTGTVQHTDTASGTTSTVNAATGAVTITTPAGQTVTGSGTVNTSGVVTTVDTKTGTVTTQNTQTGVVTQTDASTGKTVTAIQVTGTAAGGGTFLFPDTGKTVTTEKSITAIGNDAGKFALIGLVGLLLLRGAIK